MTEPLDKDTLLFMLKSIKDDIRGMDQKLETQAKLSSAHQEAIHGLVDSIKHLNKVIYTGNGKPSHTEQLSDLKHGLISVKSSLMTLEADNEVIKEDLSKIKANSGLKDPKEVRVEKWKTLGKVIVFFGLLIPGILSFFGYHN